MRNACHIIIHGNRSRSWNQIHSDIYSIANLSDADAEIVREAAEHDPPPRAASRKEVRENCQSWSVRVLARLAEKGIVDVTKVEMARSMMQPV